MIAVEVVREARAADGGGGGGRVGGAAQEEEPPPSPEELAALRGVRREVLLRHEEGARLV